MSDRPELPGLVRGLIRLLPAETRREVAAPLEETLATLLAAAARRGRLARLRALVRETGALLMWIVKAHTRGSGTDGPPFEEVTTMWGRELTFALRTLIRRPGVTAVCVATLALGVGANAAIFSVIDGVLVDNLAYADPDRVVFMGETTSQGGFSSTSWENLRDWQSAGVLESIGAVIGNSVAVTGDGPPERIRGLFVTASYFDVIGVEPVLGRRIEPGEDVPGGPRVALLSHGWWQQRFGADPGVLGRTVNLNNHPHTIVGVMPEGFRSPWDTPAAWISMHTAPRNFDRASRGFQAVIGRLSEGQTLDQALRAFEAVHAGLVEQYPDANAGRSVWMLELDSYLAETNRPFLVGLAVAVGLLLLIACANVANLQLARASARRRELAVRAALGGGRGRLIRQLVVENALLFGIGGVAGLGVGWAGVRGLLVIRPDFAASYEVSLDLGVALLALVLAVGTGLAFGLIPALEGARAHPAGALREEGRGSGVGRGASRFRSGLVVAQVALSVSLLVGAGLLFRSMAQLLGRETGFDRENLLTLEFRLPENKYPTVADQAAFYDRMLEEIAAVPGVSSVAIAQDLPFSGNGGTQPLILEGAEIDLEGAPVVRMNRISSGYVETMGMRVVEGRGFLPSDRVETEPVALVSETLAERHFPDGGALGERFYYTEQLDLATIVGVVSDVRSTLSGEPEPYVYYAYPQNPALFSSVAVRVPGDPMTVADPVRRAVWRVDPDQPVWEVMPITERVMVSITRERFTAVLIGVFAATALLLASLGLYGVMAYSVRQRERELGVRLALGAEPRRVLALVVGQGMRLAAIGLVVGVGLALLLGRSMEALVYGISVRDPLTFAGAVGALAVVATLACLIPARRAVRIDPAASLAGE